MFYQHYIKSDMKYQLLVSFLGLLILIVLTVLPPTASENLSWRKLLIGSIFSTICVLGILAVFVPNKCVEIFNIRKKTVVFDSAKLVSHGTSNVLQGHHPICGKFTAHVFRVKGRTFCAACVGLLLGGVLALVGALSYFFGDWRFSEYSTLITLLGIGGVGFGFFQFKFKNLIRLSVNTIFVLGTLLTLIGIDELVHSFFLDLFVVSMIIFWLFTRISLSQWDHERVCFNCDIEYCRIRGQKKEEGLTPASHGIQCSSNH